MIKICDKETVTSFPAKNLLYSVKIQSLNYWLSYYVREYWTFSPDISFHCSVWNVSAFVHYIAQERMSWCREISAKNLHGTKVSISGCLGAEAYRERPRGGLGIRKLFSRSRSTSFSMRTWEGSRSLGSLAGRIISDWKKLELPLREAAAAKSSGFLKGSSVKQRGLGT